jgi:hypothetical protein
MNEVAHLKQNYIEVKTHETAANNAYIYVLNPLFLPSTLFYIFPYQNMLVNIKTSNVMYFNYTM